MEIDYTEIGRRIAMRRKQLGLKQTQVEEKADIGYKYLSNIERGVSIPSTEVIMRLARALETTPDTFLVGAANRNDSTGKAAEKLALLDERQLEMAESFINWLIESEYR